ncbi:RDD family protein [Leptolyngbya boryana CZ1]|uniref:RDD family protein n=1 Tax=Leptolyngbya boryana CZ1 TaxID=3060204 RepID=A0AA96WU01_LEPBY|nr:RDD family protein [Leptolyngbya boryana]WNZ44134.1 RDD family protein [Leptolyngbya boryana CZ1]
MNTLPSETLRNLIVRYGRSLCDDPRRLEALLRDYCGTYRQEISVLTGAARERIPPDLLTSVSTMPIEIAIAQQTKRLQANLGLSEDSARWSVQSWAFALGLLAETEITACISLNSPAQPPPVQESHRREDIFQPQPQLITPPQIPQPETVLRPTFPVVRYASFWERVAAYLLDVIVVNIIGAIIGLIAGFTLGILYVLVTGSDTGIDSLEPIFVLLGIIWSWIYYAFCESSGKQATFGKSIMKLRVTDLNGQKISFSRATGRHFSKFISGLILGIGFLMPAFDEKGQALHDKIAGCLIVKD